MFLRLGVPAAALAVTFAAVEGGAPLTPPDESSSAASATALAQASAIADRPHQRRATALPALAVVQVSAPLANGDGLDEARAKLAAASQAVAAAQAAVDDATGEVPAAQLRVDTATEAQLRYDGEQRQAAADVIRATDLVAAQEVAVQQAQGQVDEVTTRMAGAVRSTYINGGEKSELAIVLEAQDPADVVGSVEARDRAARGNSNLLGQLTEAKAALVAELAQLQQAQEAAAARQRDSDAAVAQAQLALDEAKAARDSLAALVAERTAALAAAGVAEAEMQKLYDRLMAEKAAAEAAAAAAAAQAAAEKAAAEKAAAEQAAAERAAAERAAAQKAGAAAASPVTPNSAGATPAAVGGTSATRTGQAAVDFAMGFVGAGEEFRGLCLTFVDNAYAPTGGRVGTAIEQWDRANAAGHGHPGDRNPPVGAQVFWQTSDPARHAAIYAGGGMVITTEAYNGRVGLVTMEAVNSWGPYIGWATPFYG
ncbi:MAG: hypothetical protein QG597_2677 [Actinomycetota bacterium]|nr:hypothetical protein [Actinomycetota bacterium]